MDVEQWITATARPLTGTDPGLALDDLEPLRTVVGDAVVVGIGEATRFAHEIFDVRVRLLRFLVERLGFGVLAIEEDPQVGARLDAWTHGSGGDPERLLDDAWEVWRTEEFLALLHRLREHNRRARRGHDVRLVGIDVHRADPSRYVPADDAQCIVDAAGGGRVVYWGGTGHTAVHDPEPGHPPHPFPRTEGTHLRERLGRGYVSVGVVFDRGHARWSVAPASPELAESALAAGTGPRWLDLTGPVPAAVAAWLDAPTRTRVIGPAYDAARDAAFSIAGTPLRTLFDAVVHVPEVGPVTPLRGPGAGRAADPGSR